MAGRTDGELFTIINKGTGSMPEEGDRLKTDQAWELVNFLRSLEGKTPAKSAKTGASAHHR
ncbi:MAG: cytochrome c [Acidobacteriota bacterium]